MSDGFLFWYQDVWSARTAADRVAGMEAAGLSLTHLRNGRVTAISSDFDTIGEQIVVDRPTVIRRAALEDEDDFTFQYWLDVDIDVVCTVRRISVDLIVQRLYLDGLTIAQQDFVIGAVFDQVRRWSQESVGVVVDRVGGSVGEDWDAVVAGAPERVRVWPYLIGLRPDVASRHPELRDGPPIELGSLVVYDYEGVLPASP